MWKVIGWTRPLGKCTVTEGCYISKRVIYKNTILIVACPSKAVNSKPVLNLKSEQWCMAGPIGI